MPHDLYISDELVIQLYHKIYRAAPPGHTDTNSFNLAQSTSFAKKFHGNEMIIIYVDDQ